MWESSMLAFLFHPSRDLFLSLSFCVEWHSCTVWLYVISLKVKAKNKYQISQEGRPSSPFSVWSCPLNKKIACDVYGDSHAGRQSLVNLHWPTPCLPSLIGIKRIPVMKAVPAFLTILDKCQTSGKHLGLCSDLNDQNLKYQYVHFGTRYTKSHTKWS